MFLCVLGIQESDCVCVCVCEGLLMSVYEGSRPSITPILGPSYSYQYELLRIHSFRSVGSQVCVCVCVCVCASEWGPQRGGCPWLGRGFRLSVGLSGAQGEGGFSGSRDRGESGSGVGVGRIPGVVFGGALGHGASGGGRWASRLK